MGAKLPWLQLLRFGKKKYYRLALAIISSLALFLFVLFRILSQITYASIADLNKDFAAQMDVLTQTINQSIVNYGMQLYYSISTQNLLHHPATKNTDRIYALREINKALASSDFTEAVYIYNAKNQMVYSSEGGYSQRRLSDFTFSPLYRLFQEQNQQKRFRPIYCYDNHQKKDYYAFPFFDKSSQTTEVSMMILTISSQWYRRLLMVSNPESDLLVIEPSGEVILSTNSTLPRKYEDYRSLIMNAGASGYSLNRSKDEICLFYKSQSTGHIYLRISSLPKILPRLVTFRRMTLLLPLSLFLLMLLFSLVIWRLSLRRMKMMQAAFHQISADLEAYDTAEACSLDSIQRQMDTALHIAERSKREHLLHDQLTGKSSYKIEVLFHHPQPYFCMVLISAPHRRNIYEALGEEDLFTMVTKVGNLYACLLNTSSIRTLQDFAVHQLLQINPVFFLSSIYSDYQETPEHYANLSELKRLQFLLPSQQILHERLMETRKTPELQSKDFSDWMQRLKSGNLEQSLLKWQDLYQEIRLGSADEVQYYLTRAENLLCDLLSEREEAGAGHIDRLLPDSLETLTEEVELQEIFLDAISKVCGYYEALKERKRNNLAQEIVESIQLQYSDPNLSLQSLAEQFQMNHAYLGRQFKQVFSYSVSEAINRTRMEKAAEWLCHTTLSNEEIASHLGISNLKYFYVLFKKHYGTTPSQYRNLHRKPKREP